MLILSYTVFHAWYLIFQASQFPLQCFLFFRKYHTLVTQAFSICRNKLIAAFALNKYIFYIVTNFKQIGIFYKLEMVGNRAKLFWFGQGFRLLTLWLLESILCASWPIISSTGIGSSVPLGPVYNTKLLNKCVKLRLINLTIVGQLIKLNTNSNLVWGGC